MEFRAFGVPFLTLSELAAVAFPFAAVDLGLAVAMAGAAFAVAVAVDVVVFVAPLVLDLSSTTGVVLILDKPVSALGISVSLEYLLQLARSTSSTRVCALGQKLYAPGLSVLSPPFFRASVGGVFEGVCGDPGDDDEELPGT